MSLAPIMSGMVKLPNAPASMGMITKKIMTVACMLKNMLYNSGGMRWPMSAGPPGLAQDGNLGVRPAELRADQHGQEPADEQEDQRREQELDADDLVIGGEDVLADKAQLRMCVGLGFMGKADAHARSSLKRCQDP